MPENAGAQTTKTKCDGANSEPVFKAVGLANIGRLVQGGVTAGDFKAVAPYLLWCSTKGEGFSTTNFIPPGADEFGGTDFTALFYDDAKKSKSNQTDFSNTVGIGGQGAFFYGPGGTLVGGRNTKVGKFSLAIGSGGTDTYDPKGGATSTMALGESSIAIGDQAQVVLKRNSENNKGNGPSAGIAIGKYATVLDDNGVAIGSALPGGLKTRAKKSAVAIGTAANANAIKSIAVGEQATTTDTKAIAIGSNAQANTRSVAIGPQAQAKGKNSIAIGLNAIASQQNQVAIGTESSTYKLPGLSQNDGKNHAVNVDNNGNLVSGSVVLGGTTNKNIAFDGQFIEDRDFTHSDSQVMIIDGDGNFGTVNAELEQIDKNKNSIKTNTEDISRNSSDISRNSSDISRNSSDISRNSSDISRNSSNINALGSGVAGATALTAALSSLPTTADDAPFSCGVGTGGYSSRFAMSIGCAARLNERLSFNVGGSHVFGGSSNYGGGSLDTVAARAGFVFKLGTVKPATTNEEQLQSQLDEVKEDNASIRKENKDLIARLERLEAIALGLQPSLPVASLK